MNPEKSVFLLKCVARHKEERPATECREMPMCKTCFMPMILEGVIKK